MDEQTYIALVPTVRHVVLREAARYLPDEDDAADVAQEVMLKLWQLRGTLSDDKKMLYAYATVLILMFAAVVVCFWARSLCCGACC